MFLEIVTTTSNKLNDCIWGESVTGTRQQDMTENSNRRQPVLLRRQTGADAQRINSQIPQYILRQMRSRT